MAKKITLILVEAALELVPRECRGHPSVVKYAKRRGKKAEDTLLDRSYHHAAMKSLPEAHKRGRPDIIHFSLLEALGSPLNKEGKLETYVSTIDNHVIHVRSYTRIPRNYERFKGLIEQLYVKGHIVDEASGELLRLEKKTLRQLLLDEIRPSSVYLLSEDGEDISLDDLAVKIIGEEKPAIMVGAFPHGDFREETKKLATYSFRIYKESLETWTVVSRILCSIERKLLQKENIQH